MRIEELRNARRRNEDWEPFMTALERRIRAERRADPVHWAAAAALFALFLGLVALLPKRVQGPPPLRAEIPAVEAPLFTPDAQAAFEGEGYVLVMSVEEGS
jgi:hypothetical protein